MTALDWAVMSGSAWRGLGMFLLVIGAFAAVIFPYIRTSKDVYGTYFYNMNSTFMMWCDSLPEGEAFLIAYGEAGKWRELPADQDSFGHEILAGTFRLPDWPSFGARIEGVATQNAMVIAYYKFMFVFALIAVFELMRRPRSRSSLIGEKPFAAVFLPLFLLVYAALVRLV